MSNITEYNLSNFLTIDVIKEWNQNNVKEFLQRIRTDLELEANDIYEYLFKLLFGPASAIADVTIFFAKFYTQ
ncbi:16252_t:CDS:2, partial [Funneliformis caledonium]